jgi:hypothetical protein
MDVEIKFSKRNENAILEGKKFCTSRREQKGAIGDTFYLGNGVFIITEVIVKTLWDVAHYHYIEEGYESPEAFAIDWYGLHRGHFKPNQIVYVHWFSKVGERVAT